MTAPPGQIILMLFDGALRFLDRALEGFSHVDPSEHHMTVNNNLQRAREVIRELNCALNFEQGGDLAQTLHRLYNYFEERIQHSNVRKEREGIEEVIRHLTVIRNAWAAMLRGECVPSTSEPIPPPLMASVAAY